MVFGFVVACFLKLRFSTLPFFPTARKLAALPFLVNGFSLTIGCISTSTLRGLRLGELLRVGESVAVLGLGMGGGVAAVKEAERGLFCTGRVDVALPAERGFWDRGGEDGVVAVAGFGAGFERGLDATRRIGGDLGGEGGESTSIASASFSGPLSSSSSLRGIMAIVEVLRDRTRLVGRGFASSSSSRPEAPDSSTSVSSARPLPFIVRVALEIETLFLCPFAALPRPRIGRELEDATEPSSASLSTASDPLARFLEREAREGIGGSWHRSVAQEESLSSEGVESARKRARLGSAYVIKEYQHMVHLNG